MMIDYYVYDHLFFRVVFGLIEESQLKEGLDYNSAFL